MKKLSKVVLGVAILSGVVLANPATPVTKHEAKAQERFEHVKARIIYMIDKRMDFLAKHKACVEKAQNWKELRNCRPHRRVISHRFGTVKVWHKPMKKTEEK